MVFYRKNLIFKIKLILYILVSIFEFCRTKNLKKQAKFFSLQLRCMNS